MAKVYVGTYKKYNEGSLKGAWLDLAEYKTYDEFLSACKELHKDESDPEYMIQDWEHCPEGFAPSEWLGRQDFEDIKLAMKEEEQESQGLPAINIVDYSEKAFIVVGNTRVVKESLKKMGGSFNNRLSCGSGWVFPKSKREEVEKFIQSGEVIEAVSKDNAPAIKKDVALWEEFRKRVSNAEDGREALIDRHIKEASEIMMTDCGVILVFDKQRVNAGTFWFHDEGPNYEYYKSVTKDEKSKIDYFMSENLDEYDRLIKEMTERKDRHGYDLIPVFYEHEWCSKGCLGWGNSLYMMSESRAQEEEADPRSRNHFHRMSEKDAAQALTILKAERAKFEKRLQSYLKRYGTSKMQFGTYWADR